MEAELNNDMMGIIKNRAALFTTRGVGLEFDDLVQEGVIICLNALSEYQSNKGAKFTTYLYRCLTNRFCNIKKYHQQWLAEPLGEIRDSLKNAINQPSDFSMDVSEDARVCIQLAFEKFNMKTDIRNHLYQNGWSQTRINKAFKELEEYLK